jgi:hypothetical protein
MNNLVIYGIGAAGKHNRRILSNVNFTLLTAIRLWSLLGGSINIPSIVFSFSKELPKLKSLMNAIPIKDWFFKNLF